MISTSRIFEEIIIIDEPSDGSLDTYPAPLIPTSQSWIMATLMLDILNDPVVALKWIKSLSVHYPCNYP
jgi:hypothetical protein